MDRPEVIKEFEPKVKQFFTDCFSIYDPFEEGVPEFFENQLFDLNIEFLSEQIRYLTNSKTQEEISQVCTDLVANHFTNIFKKGSFVNDFVHEVFDQQKLESMQRYYKMSMHLLVMGLADDMSKNENPTHLTNLKSLSWSECFAICAAGMLTIAVINITAEEEDHNNHLIMQDIFIGPIYQLITLASSLSSKKNVWSDAITSLKRINGKKGGNKKASRFEPLKRKIIQLTDTKYGHLSKGLTIAKRILGSGYTRHDLSQGDLSYDDLRDSKGDILREGNELATIAKWINTHLKNKAGDEK